uniref:MARVEL domain-containing protein n=1 Tax=Strigamia maritima TaxID=126957 RepID=T1IX81_STRMM
MARVKFDWMATPSGISKIIAFITSVIALALYHRYANLLVLFISAYSIYSWHFCSIIAPTSSFIFLYFFVSYVNGDNKIGHHFATEIFVNFFQAILNVVVGFIVISKSMNNEWLRDMEIEVGTKAAGAMYILLAFMHLVDAFTLFKYQGIIHPQTHKHKMVELKFTWAATASGITKIVAFITSVIALTLFHRCANNIAPHIFDSVYAWQFCNVVAPTTSFILLYFFISYITGENQPGQHLITEIFFNLFNAVLNLVTGSIVINGIAHAPFKEQVKHYEVGAEASGALYIILAMIHLVDAGFILLNKWRRGNLQS